MNPCDLLTYQEFSKLVRVEVAHALLVEYNFAFFIDHQSSGNRFALKALVESIAGVNHRKTPGFSFHKALTFSNILVQSDQEEFQVWSVFDGFVEF